MQFAVLNDMHHQSWHGMCDTAILLRHRAHRHTHAVMFSLYYLYYTRVYMVNTSIDSCKFVQAVVVDPNWITTTYDSGVS